MKHKSTPEELEQQFRGLIGKKVKVCYSDWGDFPIVEGILTKVNPRSIKIDNLLIKKDNIMEIYQNE